jgi:hypothetical protein
MPQVQTPCQQQCSETHQTRERINKVDRFRHLGERLEGISLIWFYTRETPTRFRHLEISLASCGPRQLLLACSSSLPLFPPSFQSHDLQEIMHDIINFFLSITSGPSKIIAHNHQSVFEVLQLILLRLVQVQ